ncbi:Ferric reductase transmembrane component [Wickerhamomyces ciferrii]|uniref:ferric-chelate reductase (NADPH) n=1 Tax=Wickerhamomyces ciferrii (strain ATCC 14091 / BCRC 22168 / CBS 111 / JCM 3599 / NBRC 0793 / NRRL Y-1031 F-60-10) TaxID=1206466 RepID=K0KEI7_WICCF|nr:Ferric reductase transmembrane component [Wickerhamomyces ciferrii]CCH41321.1 Ferric reductase transmembrane component [Wickerhamomyces ciferrii]
MGIKWKWMPFACTTNLNKYKFGTSVKNNYPKMCGYHPLTASVVGCLGNNLGFESKGFQKGLQSFNRYCSAYAQMNYTMDDMMDIFKNGSSFMLDKSEITGNMTRMIFYQPLNITKADLADMLSYYQYLYFNLDDASMLGGMMYIFFIIVFICYGVTNLIKRLGFHRNFNNKWINWYRANISIPALFNGKHTEASVKWKIFSTLIPTRVESIVVFLFLMLSILLSCVHYSFDYPSEGSRAIIMANFVADRVGLLSFALIPLLIIFAGRNNILTSLTGIPFTSFIFYHKWVATVMWIHAMIHSAGWTAIAIHRNYLEIYYKLPYWQWGAFATVLGAVMLVQAFHVFRNLAYGTFVIIHIIFAILFIVGCWWHCYDLGWLEWIYVSWAVWIFDRVLRVIRMCVFGFRNAEIELISDDTFKVSVKHGKWFVPFPGSYAYVYFITPTMLWQSHPFTIIDSAIEKGVTTIYIKTKAGITKRINKQLSKVPGNKKTIRVSIEGPYGHRAPMKKYDTALLLAGGNGIPGPYYHAIDLAKRGSSTKQQIKLNWVVRNPEALFWFHEELKLLQHTNVQTNFYITGTIQKKESDSEKKNSSGDDSHSAEISTANGSIDGGNNFRKLY